MNLKNTIRNTAITGLTLANLIFGGDKEKINYDNISQWSSAIR